MSEIVQITNATVKTNKQKAIEAFKNGSKELKNRKPLAVEFLGQGFVGLLFNVKDFRAILDDEGNLKPQFQASNLVTTQYVVDKNFLTSSNFEDVGYQVGDIIHRFEIKKDNEIIVSCNRNQVRDIIRELQALCDARESSIKAMMQLVPNCKVITDKELDDLKKAYYG